MGTGLFVKDPEEIVPLVLARAGYEKRRMESVAAGVPWAGGMSLFYAFVDFHIPSLHRLILSSVLLICPCPMMSWRSLMVAVAAMFVFNM